MDSFSPAKERRNIWQKRIKGLKKEGIEPISAEQESFLRYVETGEVTDELTALVDNKVKEVRTNEKWRSQYMKTLTHDQDVYDSGYAAACEVYEERLTDMRASLDVSNVSIAEKDAKIAELEAKLAAAGLD